jgi:hypothetical protein
VSARRARVPLGLLLTPGAGADRDAPALVAIDAAATGAGLTVERMDFPYRKAGRKSPDRAPVLIAAVRDEAARLAPTVAGLVLGGRSMGAPIGRGPNTSPSWRCPVASSPAPAMPSPPRRNWRRLPGPYPVRSLIAGWTARIMPSAAPSKRSPTWWSNGCVSSDHRRPPGAGQVESGVSRRRPGARRRPRWRRRVGPRPPTRRWREPVRRRRGRTRRWGCQPDCA